ncbi:oxygen-regulated protein 1-like [Channa argus]|uniref:oxygen-regulated protein 1-like n=1 Tax=Channa argus TaxID=215402 RepID=UPI00352152CA
MNDTGLWRVLPDQSSGSGHTFGSPRHPSITDPILSKRVCFYKSGDPQFNGLRLVINSRTFKTFDALLDNLSKKVPLPFGVRNITTPRGVHAIYTLDELEDGKSYICSDSRKVKPINLALARKKLRPWYHARPVSSRRRTIQQTRLFPGWSIHKQEPVAVRTPKRLLVFRNGDPTIKHTVVLHKRITPTFKSVLEYISEVIQFHVVKLHTLDGRRIDGLPGLILCSGTVVAAGREPFRPANYNAQKLSAPTRTGLRRLKALNESFYNPPSNTTNSVELESAHLLEPVAGTEGDTPLGDGAEGRDCLLPTEDDIEKSFRVNQDGSMTVEMRVRLTIKEEETIHWTTTVTRSGVANQLNETCLPESEAEQETCSPQSNLLDLESSAACIDTINKDKSKDNNDEDPPSPNNGVFNESSNEEDNVKEQMEAVSPRRAPTPGHKHVRKKQAWGGEGIQGGMVGSYSYREQTSMQKDNDNEPYDISKSMSLSGVNSSTFVTNDYVEKWLEDAHHNPTAYPDGESKKLNKKENSILEDSGNNSGLITVVEEGMCSEEKSEKQNCQTLKSDPVLGTSVKLRIQSFENTSSIPLVEKTTATQPVGHGHADTTKKENSLSVAQHNTEEIKPISNGICSEMNPLTNRLQREMSSGSETRLVETSWQEAAHSMPLPPPPADITELSNSEYYMMDVSPVLSSTSYKLSSVSSITSNNHPLSISPASDKAASPTDNTMKTTVSVQTNIPSTLREAPLPRTQSTKRAPLVSNLSLERKMSLRKACLDKYTLCSDATSETSSTPINTPNDICSKDTPQPSKTLPEDTAQKSILDLMSNPSCCTSASPSSLTSDDRLSSASISSSEAPTLTNLQFKETKMPLSTQKEVPSPKALVKKVQIMSSPSPERKPQSKKLPSYFPNGSPKVSSLHNRPSHNTVSHNTEIQKHATPNASPATEKKLLLHKPKLQKSPSPYSQSLDMASPPVRQKLVRKTLSRNLSSDNGSEPANKTQRKTSFQRKGHETTQLIKSKAKLDKSLTCETAMLEASQIDTSKVSDDFTGRDQEGSMTGTQRMPQPLNIANQPNIKPVLDKVCFSIKSIRQITHNKRPSCLEKSNSLPDFSSHVASMFGSSSKVLLAFLSVMTLKECITNFNVDELNANNVSCAETLKMIDSLREIASIEDSQRLKCSLSDLQQSASKQLLQSWRGFQELSDKCRSHSSTSNNSEHGLITEGSLEKHCGIEESVITEIMDNLDIPEKLKKELAFLSVGVKSESDDEENVSTKIIKKLSLKENCDLNLSQSSTEDTVRDVTQDEMVNIDVKSIIKNFVDTNQPKRPNMDNVPVVTNRGEDGQNVTAKCPQAETEDNQLPEERHVNNEQNWEAMKSCRAVVNEENKHQGYTDDKSNQGMANRAKKHLEQQSCSYEREKQDMECRQLHTFCDESGSDKEGQEMSSADDVEEKERCKESISISDMGEQHSSEEDQPEVHCEEINQESSECDLSTCEGHFEEEDYNQTSPNYYVELNFTRKESITSPDNNALSNPASPATPQKEEGIQKSCMGLNDNSTNDSDVDESPSSEEEQREVECQELEVRTVENLEEEQGSIEEEKEMKTSKKLQILIEETEEDIVRGQSQNAVGGEQSILIENQNLYTKNNNSSLTKSDSLSKHYRFNTDEDSGNEHSSYEKQVEVEKPKIKDEQISCSTEEKLSYYEKESRLEKEHANMDRHVEVQPMATETEDTKCEKAVVKQRSKDAMSRSVAERVSLLEKQVADAQKTKDVTESSAMRHFSQKNLESDVEGSPSESPTSQSALCTRSAPQSSLSFSYDSSGVITTEPEGSRVRSIREMFLAKSGADNQHGNRCFASPNASELSQLRGQTSVNGGYQSQNSGEMSSGEDDSAHKSISKGFVRRTIERLYGKKDTNPDGEASERPPSVPKQKKKEHSSIFSPFHAVRSKAMSEMSYFNSTTGLDTWSEATRCIAFNAQVGPGDIVPLDDGEWLLKENTLMRKSVSDPVGINKTFTSSSQGEGMCEDTEESSPYSLFSTKSEQEEKKTFSRKCTYFSLPHASDSDVCQDDQSTVNKSSVNGDSIADTKDKPEDSNTWAERNATLPAGGVTDFKMMDNKVHPLIEDPSDSEPIVVQPGKGQGAMNTRLQEPDMLDFLYNFCGQHCPIL